MRKLGLSLGLGVVLVAGRLVWADVTAFHADDLMIVVAVGLLVLEAVLAKLVLLARPDWAAQVGSASWSAWLDAGLGIVLFAILTPAIAVLWLNQGLDVSDGVPRTLTVAGKWLVTYRGGSHGCRVGVTSGVPRRPPIAFPWSSDLEAIVVPCADFAEIAPGRSTVTLAVHPGALGLPWYGDVSVSSHGSDA